MISFNGNFKYPAQKLVRQEIDEGLVLSNRCLDFHHNFDLLLRP